MTRATKQLLTAVLGLPGADCVELIEALLASVDPSDGLPFDESWLEVIQRRSAELSSGSVVAILGGRSRGKLGSRSVADLLFHPETRSGSGRAGKTWSLNVSRGPGGFADEARARS